MSSLCLKALKVTNSTALRSSLSLNLIQKRFPTTTEVATRKKKHVIDETPKVIVPTRTFREEIKRCQRRIVKSITHMIPLNPAFRIEYHEKDFQQNQWFKFDDVLLIYTANGRFQFRPNYEQNLMVFISCVTGHMVYEYHPDTDSWLSNKFDQHDMIGMFVRDMNHNCMGCPNFNFTEEELNKTKFSF